MEKEVAAVGFRDTTESIIYWLFCILPFHVSFDCAYFPLFRITNNILISSVDRPCTSWLLQKSTILLEVVMLN
jgi:hypothetical protein